MPLYPSFTQQSNSSLALTIALGNLEFDYRFNQNTGTQLIDYSSNARHGTLYGSASWNSPIGLSFPANGEPYVLMPNFDFFFTPFTLECLFLCKDYTRIWARIFDFSVVANSAINSDYFTNTVSGQNYAGSDSTGLNLQVPYLRDSSLWTYLQIVFDGSTVSAFINGVLITRKPFTARTNTKTICYLGKSNFNDPYFFGLITSFRYYSRILSNKELSGNIVNTYSNLLLNGLYVQGASVI